MINLNHVRTGYQLLGGYGHSREYHGIPVITVEEIGRVAETLGDLAALVYACALVGPSGSHINYSNVLARDLVNFGPWSFSADAWTCADARRIMVDSLLADPRLGCRALGVLDELASY